MLKIFKSRANIEQKPKPENVQKAKIPIWYGAEVAFRLLDYDSPAAKQDGANEKKGILDKISPDFSKLKKIFGSRKKEFRVMEVDNEPPLGI